ncbi:MAG: hypothetical protein K0R21_2153 [Anaerocolumna sp.]|jgi:hypothetical protein|nr:hypothetical protein [Anaerocolumna sp.]
MLSREEYIQISLENNLFWTRIMKEHAIFIESVLTPPLKEVSMQADEFKRIFEELLANTMELANETISMEALQSGEFYTRFTDEAERLTQQFTGIEIDRNLTYTVNIMEPSTIGMEMTEEKEKEVSWLNQNIISQLTDFLQFKANLLSGQASCNAKSLEYTSILEHVLEEGRKYMEILTTLQDREMPADEHLVSSQEEFFWNMIMSDHAKIMRGKFDPVEIHFFNEANRFAKIYDTLTSLTWENDEVEEPLINVHDVTSDFRDFKAFTTQGIIECKVSSVMMPLFTDHILREANHYLRLMTK